MRDLTEINRYRRCDWEIRAHRVVGDSGNGCFVIPYQAQGAPVIELACIASNGGGWDHVSVSTRDRCPTWDELEFVRKLFAKPSETWVQFHVPESEHINVHPHCLHLWRKQAGHISKPPAEMVGFKMRASR